MAEDIDEGRLALVHADGWPLRRELAVVSHRDRRVSRCLRQFLDIAARDIAGPVRWAERPAT